MNLWNISSRIGWWAITERSSFVFKSLSSKFWVWNPEFVTLWNVTLTQTGFWGLEPPMWSFRTVFFVVIITFQCTIFFHLPCYHESFIYGYAIAKVQWFFRYEMNYVLTDCLWQSLQCYAVGFHNFDSVDAYDLADVLKRYFRELPESLLSPQASQLLMTIFTG